MEFHDIVIQQKSYFDSNSTKSIAFRKIMLKKIEMIVLMNGKIFFWKLCIRILVNHGAKGI